MPTTMKNIGVGVATKKKKHKGKQKSVKGKPWRKR